MANISNVRQHQYQSLSDAGIARDPSKRYMNKSEGIPFYDAIDIMEMTKGAIIMSEEEMKSVRETRSENAIRQIGVEKGKYTLLFCGDGCPQCVYIKPKFIDECKKVHIKYGIINATEEPEFAERLGIRGVPYAIVFNDGEIIDRGHASDIMNKLKTY